MNKSSESGLVADAGGAIVSGGLCESCADTATMMVTRGPDFPRPYCVSISDLSSSGNGESKRSEEADDDKREEQKFAMIFNKYSNNLRPSSQKSEDAKTRDRTGCNKYTMIFNKDVTIRSKSPASEETKLLKAIEPEQSSVKLNDAETLMTLYGRSNLFIPELTMSSLMSEVSDSSRRRRCNDPGLRMYSSLTALPKAKPASGRRILGGDGQFKRKAAASLTSLESHAGAVAAAPRDAPRKHVSVMQERKLCRVRSLDWSESVVSSSDGSSDGSGSRSKGLVESSHKKSWGDGTRRGDKDGGGGRKHVQWKSEVDVIYFESHQAADGDSCSGEILGRVMEPLREEWEQQRSGFYAKMVPLQLGNHFSERWQSLLKI